MAELIDRGPISADSLRAIFEKPKLPEGKIRRPRPRRYQVVDAIINANLTGAEVPDWMFSYVAENAQNINDSGDCSHGLIQYMLGE